jgi:CHAD domain-containing protein
VKGYQINMELPLEESLKAVILGCVSFIQEQIRDRQEIHIPVHETRRTTRRIRAVLQMIRDEIGYSNYYRENIFYRDLARRISPLRDHYVLQRTIAGFHHEFPEEFPESEVMAIGDSLNHLLEDDIRHFTDRWGGFDRIREELDKAAGRVDHYCRLRNGFVSVRKGVCRVYKRGYKYPRILQESFSKEQFHEYRKSTKYLLYQMELIRPAYPKMITAYAGTINKHAEMIGNTRDYERLERYILAGMGSRHLDANRRRMVKGIQNRREELMQKIYSGANRIYAEKPSGFVKRLGTYWNTKQLA